MTKNAKIYILKQKRNFAQKSKFWTKIEILDKNRNVGQKSKFWTKIEILNNNRNFDEIFDKKSEFSTKKIEKNEGAFFQCSKMFIFGKVVVFDFEHFMYFKKSENLIIAD